MPTPEDAIERDDNSSTSAASSEISAAVSAGSSADKPKN